MDKNLDIVTYAVSLIIKAVIMAGRFSGTVRKRSLRRLAAMNADTKDKEILFLKDKLYQLQTQLSILQKRVKKHQKKPRYTLRERLFILWHIEIFGIAGRKVTEHLGVSRSTLYRWLHQINDTSHTRIPANKTPLEIAVLIWEITGSNIDWGRVRISVTERVIKTLKYEWLKRVSFIRGFDHLVTLCEEFEDWYNTWRPHMTLDAFRPDDVYYDRKPKKPQRDSKTVPGNIQQHLLRETRVTGYRLKSVT